MIITHCLDILKAALKNTDLSDYVFIPVIETGDRALRQTAEKDFKSLGITEFYIGAPNDFKEDTQLDQKLKPVYERADQLIEISTKSWSNQKRFLKPGTSIKSILEHEKLEDGYVFLPEITGTKHGWEIKDKTHPTFTCCLGLSPIAQGIKIEDVNKMTPAEFFSTLQSHDSEFALKLLEKTNSNNFAEFTENNTFLHAYFNDFRNSNGFSVFLALVTANSMRKSNNKDIVVHLSSGIRHPLRTYIDEGIKWADEPFLSGISVLTTIFTKCLPDVDIKQIEFYGGEGEFKTSEDSKSCIYPINRKGTRTIRVFNEFLSKQSFQSIYDAAEMVGVSGDNTSKKVLRMVFYHFIIPPIFL